ncbi:hypothetical protein [Pseudoduganella violacea]|uniref:Jacalin-type lectin domain-containing protein n=1 Tax=Pseudoduganella violacea TaxID=1715466 RepID=A0A7W5BER5_9BURK|nr:hypothetical protein [Pseudoduganella violacea]MBB3121769.1 hypothetical protein [Pseudoduganella violacea]
MEALAGKKQMSFGGHGGSFSSIQGTGGQQVLIKSGSKIDSIQIGNVKYGGGGGTPTASFTLPADGKFSITRMCINGDVIGYIQFVCDGVTYQAGQVTGDGDLSFGSGLPVSFAGIASGSMVDMILFNTDF